MDFQVTSLSCPSCGEPLRSDMEYCPACGRPVVITSFHSIYEMTNEQTKEYVKKCQSDLEEPVVKASAAKCWLKLGMYEKAATAFEQALETDLEDSESYFYAAVCQLKGKRAFLAPLRSIKKIQEYVDAAIYIEDRGVYHLFLSYIKLDFYARKALSASPDWREELKLARQNQLSAEDVRILFAILRVPVPEEFKLS